MADCKHCHLVSRSTDIREFKPRSPATSRAWRIYVIRRTAESLEIATYTSPILSTVFCQHSATPHFPVSWEFAGKFLDFSGEIKRTSGEENPLKQVFNYIRELKDKKINDCEGKLVTQINGNTPFFCYVVCDVTPKLLETLENFGMNSQLPGDRGYYGYNKSLNTYVEILEYNQLVKDARLRNDNL